MSKQVNYIITAFLLLAFLVGSVQVIKIIPRVQIVDDSNTGWCGTESPPTFALSENAIKGKTLFMNKCASCHTIGKDAVGPALAGFEERGPWSDREKLYSWIKNPSLFMSNDPYTQNLKKTYPTMMQSFDGTITKEEIDAICNYIKESGAKKTLPLAQL